MQRAHRKCRMSVGMMSAFVVAVSVAMHVDMNMRLPIMGVRVGMDMSSERFAQAP